MNNDLVSIITVISKKIHLLKYYWMEHIMANGRLRQTVAQMIVLVHMLPYLIAEYVINEEDIDVCNRLWSHVQLLQILNMCLTYEISSESVDLLSWMIQMYIGRFNNLYPDCCTKISLFDSCATMYSLIWTSPSTVMLSF